MLKRNDTKTALKSVIWQFISQFIELQVRVAARMGTLRKAARHNTAAAEIDLTQVKHVLIVRLDEIGDAVMFTPFLREIRKLLPVAHVTLVVKSAIYNLVELCPYVDEVIGYDQNVPRALRPLVLPGRALCAAARNLRKRRYDLAMLPRRDADYYYATFLAYFSSARWRVGYSEKTTPQKRIVNRGFDLLLTHKLEQETLKHDVESNLDVLKFLGMEPSDNRQELWVNKQDEQFADALLQSQGADPDNLLIALGPAGGHSVLKQWPRERFAALGKRLASRHNAKIVIVGGPGEEALGRDLAQQIGPATLNITGQTTLRQTAAVLARCHCYIGNDSGPTHIAAAVGIPVVAIFGSSCRHRYHPGENSTLIWRELPCSPCQQGHTDDRCKRCIFDQPKCLWDISVEEVENAVEDALFGRLDHCSSGAQKHQAAQVSL